MSEMSLGEAASIFQKDADRTARLAKAAAAVLEAQRGSESLIRTYEELGTKVAQGQKQLTDMDAEVSRKREQTNDVLKRLEDQFTADKSSVEQDIEARRQALKDQRVQLDKDLDTVGDQRRQASEDVREAENAGRVKAEELEAAHRKRMTDLQGIEQDLKTHIENQKSLARQMQASANNIPV